MDLQEYLPVIHILCNPGLRQRHWDKINDIAGENISPDSGTSLRKMLRHKLEPFLEQFEVISAAASKEHSLEKAMQKMEDDWDEIIFNTTMYRDTGMCVHTHACTGTQVCACTCVHVCVCVCVWWWGILICPGTTDN